jgi:hypothetical protein
MIPIYNSDTELSLDFNSKRYYRRKARKEKEQLIRELTQNNKDLKQFSYNISQPQSTIIKSYWTLNLLEDIPIESN